MKAKGKLITAILAFAVFALTVFGSVFCYRVGQLDVSVMDKILLESGFFLFTVICVGSFIVSFFSIMDYVDA